MARVRFAFSLIGVLVACGGTAVIDGDNSASGQGGDAGSTSGTGGIGPTTSAGPTSTGAGGGACLKCYPWLDEVLSQRQAPPVEALCGYDPSTGSCAPSSSCSIMQRLTDCLCGECAFVCGDTCFELSPSQSDCALCTADAVTDVCAQALNTCAADI